MIKLKKIINGRINTPEPMRMPIDISMPYSANCLFYLSGNALGHDTTDLTEKKFISLDEHIENDYDKRYLLAYEVTRDMIFEVDVENADKAKIGVKGTFVSRGDFCKNTLDVNDQSYPEAIVIDSSEALTKGKVTIQMLV